MTAARFLAAAAAASALSLLAAFVCPADVEGRPAEVDFPNARGGSDKLAPNGPEDAGLLSPSAATLSPVAALNSFGFRLLHLVSKEKRNAFLSPVSVAAALGMTAAGATGGSATQIELEAALPGLRLTAANGALGALSTVLSEAVAASASSGANITLANSGWFDPQAGIHEGYKASLDKLFDAVAEPLSNGEAINEWVEGKTNGLVTDLVAPGPVDAAVVLVNAIHFKGSWSKAFDPKMTRRGTFYTPDGAITVQMMESKLDYWDGKYWAVPLQDGPDVEVVELCFGNTSEFAAVIMMPSLSGKEEADLAKDPATLDSGHLDTLVEQLSKDPALQDQLFLGSPSSPEMILRLPRFKVEAEIGLRQTLVDMGIETPFTQTPGQFRRITTDMDLMISNVVHKAVLEVNEEGAEAAAATAVFLMPLSMPPPPIRVTVNRPFLFFIRNKKTGAVIFTGRMDNPVFI